MSGCEGGTWSCPGGRKGYGGEGIILFHHFVAFTHCTPILLNSVSGFSSRFLYRGAITQGEGIWRFLGVAR